MITKGLVGQICITIAGIVGVASIIVFLTPFQDIIYPDGDLIMGSILALLTMLALSIAGEVMLFLARNKPGLTSVQRFARLSSIFLIVASVLVLSLFII